MDRVRNILVAVDGSPGAAAALTQAARLAQARKVPLHAIHVVRNDYAAELQQLIPGGRSDVDKRLIEAAREQIAPTLKNIDLSEPLDLRVVVGHPVKEIRAFAEELRADLVVLGTTGESAKHGIGSTAIRCVRKVTSKVLLVPPHQTGPFSGILAAIDFSPLSPVVMDHALRIARLDGGTVTAVHVYEMPWERSRWGPPNANIEGLEDEFRSMMTTKFYDELAPHVGDVPVRFELVKDVDAGRGLVQYAANAEAGIVVTGTTGRSMLGYMLLGTTAEKIMQTVGCAVLAVKLESLQSEPDLAERPQAEDAHP